MHLAYLRLPHSLASGVSICRRHVLLIAKICLGILILIFVLGRIDRARLAQLLEGADPKYIVLSILALVLGVVINAHRWAVIAHILGDSLKLATAVCSSFESMMFNQILPASVGGDAARVVCAMEVGVASGRAIIGVMIDRALGLCILAFCLIAASMTETSPIVGSPTFRILFVTSAVVLAGAGGGVLCGAVLAGLRGPAWALALVSLLRGLHRVAVSRLAPVLFIDLLLTTAVTLLSFIFCAQAVNVTLPWLDALIVVQGITLASVIPASIGGWGVREGAAVLLLSPLGLPPSQAVAISVVFGLSITALGLIGSVFWICRSHRRHRHHVTLKRRLEERW